jgi:hypothetical protein
VVADLARVPAAAVVVTFTAAAMTCSLATLRRTILRRTHQITERIQPLGALSASTPSLTRATATNDLGQQELGSVATGDDRVTTPPERSEWRH